MQKRYTVTVEFPNRFDRGYTARFTKTVRTLDRALRLARRLADRHSVTTRYSASRYPLVAVVDRMGSAPAVVMAPYFVPSVGELGYW